MEFEGHFSQKTKNMSMKLSKFTVCSTKIRQGEVTLPQNVNKPIVTEFNRGFKCAKCLDR